jgi:subtilase family serine protease
MKQHSFRSLASLPLTFAAALGVFALAAGLAFAAPAAQGTNMGPEDASKQISVTVWLNLHHQAALDTAVEQMYDKASPNYHKFLTMKQLNEKFGATAKDAGVVRDFLASHKYEGHFN